MKKKNLYSRIKLNRKSIIKIWSKTENIKYGRDRGCRIYPSAVY